jgi:hypothetical protein
MSDYTSFISYKCSAIESKTQEIHNFSFPFINRELHSAMLGDLKTATEILIKDAKDYLIYLDAIEKNL